MTIKHLSITLLLLALPQRGTAQTPSDTLCQLDSAWARSYATHDTALAQALFADSLVMTGPRGRVKDKKGEVSDVRPSPGLRMHYFRTRGVAVRAYGSAGVVTGLCEWSFTMNDQVSTYRYRYTATYVRGGPLGWQMVALHLGPAPEQP